MKILKIGGSFITKKSGYREPELENLQKIAKEIASIWKRGVRDFVLVHGAGSYGHALVLKYGINDGVRTDEQKRGYADTHAACSELSMLVVQALINEGIPALSISPANIIEQNNKRISKFNEAIVHEYLKNGFLPVLYGDMVPDSALGGSVCSGDQIVAYLAREAEFVVLATNVDGVLDDSGKVIERITPSNFSEIAKHLKKTENDVTGGMEGKIKELLSLQAPSYIVNAAYPERVEALMLGKKAVCTEVRK
ncbi:MAG: isopentenyl phosphate kinase [Candidatus ainarchaeum sp.]|nr:isopentenyl phosphate kinase [Candidatus ainarchaeum sp.]